MAGTERHLCRRKEQAMARPREFDEDEVLEKALAVFWAKGFEGATVDDLEQATGLGRGSLYGAFGGKHELFLRAFGRYGVDGAGKCPLAQPGAGRAGIITFFREAGREALADRDRRGCMVTNCAVELAAADTQVAALVARHLDRLERGFEAAVREAQARGEIAAGRDPVRVARFLTVCLQGMQVLARARPDAAWLEDLVAAVDEALG
jgi:TetR/AcrR family transcriptional repressor of nem operon